MIRGVHIIGNKDGTFASVAGDHTIKLWRPDGTCLATLARHTNTVKTLIELKDGTLASGSGDNTIKLWTFPPMN